MRLSRRTLLGTAAAATLPAGALRAQSTPTLKFGVLTDLSGPYADVSGSGSV